jgi:hypothetical protein
MTQFNLTELAESAGLPYQTCVVWQKTGVLEPRALRGSGKKKTAIYDEKHLFACCCVASLQRQGVQGPALHTVLKFLTRANLKARLAAGLRFLVIADGKRVWNALPEAVFTTDGSRPVSFVTIDIEAAWDAFRARLAARRKEQTCLAN